MPGQDALGLIPVALKRRGKPPSMYWSMRRWTVRRETPAKVAIRSWAGRGS